MTTLKTLTKSTIAHALSAGLISERDAERATFWLSSGGAALGVRSNAAVRVVRAVNAARK